LLSFALFTLTFATISPAARYLVAITPFFSALMVRLIWRVAADKDVIWQNWYKFRFAISVGTAVIYLSTCITFIGLMFYCLREADFTKVDEFQDPYYGPIEIYKLNWDSYKNQKSKIMLTGSLGKWVGRITAAAAKLAEKISLQPDLGGGKRFLAEILRILVSYQVQHRQRQKGVVLITWWEGEIKHRPSP
jgi:hypothetical protein